MKTVTIANEQLLPELAKLLAEGHTVSFKPKGNSMLPFIVGGRDSVILQKVDNLRKGNIVLAEVVPHTFVLHRIVSINNGCALLMGDGNLQGTERCGTASIIGKAIIIIRNGKYISCSKKSERFKAYLWHLFLPIRRYLLAIYNRL